VLVIVGVTAGAVVAAVVLQDLSNRPADLVEWRVGLVLVVVTIGAGLAAWARRPDTPIGRRLVALGLLSFTDALLRSNDASIFTVGNLVAASSAAVLANVVVTYPSGRTETRLERVVLTGTYGVVAFFCIARATTTDFGPRCVRCPDNHLYVGGYPDVFDAVNRVSAVLVALAATGIAIVLAAKWRRSGRAARRVLGPPYVSAAVIVALLIATHPSFDNRGPTAGGGLVVTLALFSFPITIAIGLTRGHMARAAASDLLIDLAHDGDLEEATARALGDPTARLFRSVPAGFLEPTAPQTSVAPGRRRAIVERGGRQLGVVEHDAALADEPERLTAVLSAIGLALDRARLADEVQTQLDLVASSRARIVAAADEERRRIERNLHDGAQQRLVGASMLVRRARSRAQAAGDAEQAALLTSAANEVDQGLREIRELARGLQPPMLTDRGLVAALECLAEAASIPTSVRSRLEDRPASVVETAAYFVASESLANAAKHAHATSVVITAERCDDDLIVRIDDDGHGGAVVVDRGGLAGLRDRVEALGGALLVDSRPGRGTTVMARLPDVPT
jgi:signal transduction histidine kinase